MGTPEMIEFIKQGLQNIVIAKKHVNDSHTQAIICMENVEEYIKETDFITNHKDSSFKTFSMAIASLDEIQERLFTALKEKCDHRGKIGVDVKSAAIMCIHPENIVKGISEGHATDCLLNSCPCAEGNN